VSAQDKPAYDDLKKLAEQPPKNLNTDNPKLWQGVGFNIMLEARIATMVKMTKKYTDVSKDQLKVMIGAIVERYWEKDLVPDDQ
jgi:hypothetical protein